MNAAVAGLALGLGVLQRHVNTGTPLKGVPIVLSPYCPRDQILYAMPGQRIWVDGAVIMHPLDFHGMNEPPGSIERLRARLDYIVAEANRKLDALERRLSLS